MAKHFLSLSKILQKLLYDKRMNASELAKEVDLPIPTVHRIVTGKSTRPYKASLQPIADYFSISLDQLVGEEPLPNDLSLEQKVTKPIREIPLLNWENLSAKDKPKVAVDFIVASQVSETCFATLMCDSSMAPHFPQGTVLIFEPKKEASDRSFVLVHLAKSNCYVFRQILFDADYKFLKPLNPELKASQMRILEAQDELIATLVEARQLYNQH